MDPYFEETYNTCNSHFETENDTTDARIKNWISNIKSVKINSSTHDTETPYLKLVDILTITPYDDLDFSDEIECIYLYGMIQDIKKNNITKLGYTILDIIMCKPDSYKSYTKDDNVPYLSISNLSIIYWKYLKARSKNESCIINPVSKFDPHKYKYDDKYTTMALYSSKRLHNHHLYIDTNIEDIPWEIVIYIDNIYYVNIKGNIWNLYTINTVKTDDMTMTITTCSGPDNDILTAIKNNINNIYNNSKIDIIINNERNIPFIESDSIYAYNCNVHAMTIYIINENLTSRKSRKYIKNVDNALTADTYTHKINEYRYTINYFIVNNINSINSLCDYWLSCIQDISSTDQVPSSTLISANVNTDDLNSTIKAINDDNKIGGIDYKSLYPKEWLRRDVIDGYIKLVITTYNLQSTICSVNDKDRVHNMGEKFIPYITDEEDNIKTIFDYNINIIPINLHNNHWGLCIIDFKKKTIIAYDPVDREVNYNLIKSRVLEFLCTNYAYIKPSTIDLNEWKYIRKNKSIPLQNDGFNCGVYVCLYAVHYILNIDGYTFNETNINEYRDKILVELYNKKFDKSIYEKYIKSSNT